MRQVAHQVVFQAAVSVVDQVWTEVYYQTAGPLPGRCQTV
jgi:hypothetical protein